MVTLVAPHRLAARYAMKASSSRQRWDVNPHKEAHNGADALPVVDQQSTINDH